jgi:RNA polymerase sigma-70 factor (ECF subfamily)
MPAASPAEFTRLLEPILDQAFGLALHMSRNRDDASDLVQEASISAFKHFDQFQPGTNFKAWFFRILINCFRQAHRMASRRPDTVDLEDAPDLYMFCKTAEAGLHAVSQDPAELVLGRIDSEQVNEAIEKLPEDYRAAASLYFLQELSYEEISGILDCPLGTVRSRLHRGRKLLQKALWEIAEANGIITDLQSGRQQTAEARR